MNAHADDAKWMKELDNVVDELVQSAGQTPRREYDINRIRRRVDPPSVEALALELTRHVANGELTTIYRVISPETKNGIAEFSDFNQIPDVLYDESSDREFDVKPYRDVELIYRGLRSPPDHHK
jgi:hypothetical protein